MPMLPQNGYQVIGKGASNQICEACAHNAVSNGEGFFGPVKGGYDSLGTSFAQMLAVFGFSSGDAVGAGASGSFGGTNNGDEQ